MSATETTAPAKKNNALAKPVRATGPLVAVIGADTMPRTEVTTRLWAYIKERGLQDPQKKRDIVGDDALRAVFDGQERVDMMQMPKLVNRYVENA